MMPPPPKAPRRYPNAFHCADCPGHGREPDGCPAWAAFDGRDPATGSDFRDERCQLEVLPFLLNETRKAALHPAAEIGQARTEMAELHADMVHRMDALVEAVARSLGGDEQRRFFRSYADGIDRRQNERARERAAAVPSLAAPVHPSEARS